MASVGERDGTYYYSISRQVDGRRRQEYRRFGTAGERDRALHRRLVELDEGIGERQRGGALGVYLAEWLTGLHDVRAGTRHTYTTTVANYIRPHLGSVQLTRLRAGQVKTWHATLLRLGLSRATIRLAHGVLTRALSDGVKAGELSRNVASLVSPPALVQAEARYWTLDEARAFLGAVAGHAWAAPYVLMLATGLRQGECLALTWDDVDLGAGMLRVRRTMTRDERGRAIVGSEPKSKAGLRRIKLDASTVDEMRRQRDRLQFSGQVWGWCFPGDQVERPLTGPALRYRFRKLCRLAGVEPIPLHGLRHTHATLLLAGGVDMRTASARLGHSSVARTMDLYGHTTEEMEQRAADAVSMAFGERIRLAEPS